MMPSLLYVLALCCLPTSIFFMDVVPFRQFLKSKPYTTSEDISDAVGQDKGVDELCQWRLDLRDGRRGRKSIGDCIQ